MSHDTTTPRDTDTTTTETDGIDRGGQRRPETDARTAAPPTAGDAGAFARGGRFGATLSALVAVVGALAVGVAADATLAATVAVPGAALAGRAVGAVAREDNAARARGSVGVVVGLLAVVAGIGVAAAGPAPAGVVAAVALGVLGVAVTGAVPAGDDRRLREPVVRTLNRSATVLGAGAVLSAALFLDLFGRAAVAVAAGVAAVAGYSDLMLVLAVQVAALLALFLVDLAAPVLDRWVAGVTGAATDDEEDGRVASAWERHGVSVDDVPRGVVVVLAVQFAVALFAPGLLEGALSLIPVVGAAVHLGLRYWLFHAPFLLVAGAAATVLAARGLQRLVVVWAGRDPARALAYAAGAVLVAVPTVAVGALPVVEGVLAALPAAGSTAGQAAGGVGLGAVLLGTATGALVLARGLLAFAPLAAGYLHAASRRRPLAAGAALLLVGSVAAAAGGAFGPGTFVGVAAALVAWDVGENAAALSATLGAGAPTREGEVGHAAAAVVVGALGVGLATVAQSVVGPVSALSTAAVGPARARAAIVLALLGLVALASVALDPGEE